MTKSAVKNLTKILIFLLCCFLGCKRITSAERPEWRKVWICSMCFSSADKLSSLHCLYLLDCGSIHAWGACSACWRHRRSCTAWQLWAGYRASARFYCVLLLMSVIVQSLRINVTVCSSHEAMSCTGSPLCFGTGQGWLCCRRVPPAAKILPLKTDVTWKQQFPPQCCCLTLSLN